MKTQTMRHEIKEQKRNKGAQKKQRSRQKEKVLRRNKGAEKKQKVFPRA